MISKTYSIPSFTEMDQLIKFCQVLATAPFYQKMGPGGVLAMYLTAKEMNLPLMCALNGGLYTFDGKVTMSAQLMKVMIVNAGGTADIEQIDETVCKIKFSWKGKSYSYSYSAQEAYNAGYYSKDNWKKHPKDMLYARALSGGARKFMPEVIMGAYVIGELDSDNTISETVFEEVKEQEQLQIDAVRTDVMTKEQHSAFCIEHNLVEGTLEYEYAKEVSTTTSRDIENIISSAIKNPVRFKNGFTKWLADKTNPEAEKTKPDSASIQNQA